MQTAAQPEPRTGAPGTSLPSTVIEPVRSIADRDEFIDFQLKLYAGDPDFVAPIVAERRDFFDPRKNPFLSHAEIGLFLARRAGRVVGRIAAINDPHYNQFHNTETGFFGMFESIDDPEVAGAMLDAASEWVRGKGMKQIMGPVNLSFNRDCGVLVDGLDLPTTMMMAYNPRYYPALLEGAGLRKAKDLLSFEMSTSLAPPEKVVRVAEKVREQDGVRVRPLNMKDMPEELRRIKSIYNAMLDRSWGFGFVPMSEEEFDFIAARLRPLVQIRPELCLIAEVKGEPAAFSLTLPDSNVALKRANGRLTTFGLPLGLAKMFWAARRIDRLRVLLFGIKPGYRRRGLDAILALDTLRAARDLGYSWGEIGWAAEDNTLMIRAIEAMGARRYKTYRIYERSV
ncbi:MAG TPA: N-acetyltransferase [Myxococcaceae bacterium]|nr:N-acetyltransferase [Myxococcaceae bacterium]